MRKLFAGWLCSLGLSMTVQAQTPVQDSKPVFAREPEWMYHLYDSTIQGQNYKELVARFQAYRASLPGGGKKTPYNKHVINYFSRWQTDIAPFVSEDGIIRLPEQGSYRHLIGELNTQNERAARRLARGLKVDDSQLVENWTVMAPMVTYDYQTKKAVPWQSNTKRFDVAPTNPDVLYTGIETGMVFKSTDKGKSWKPCAPMHYFGGEISSIEISQTNENKVLVGAGMTLWLTEDGGETWKDITPARVAKFKRVRDAVLDPKDDKRMIMGSDEGVFVSSDNGKTWQKKLNGRCFDIKYRKEKGTSVVYFLVNENNTGAGAFLYKSENDGLALQKVDIPADKPLNSGRLGLTAADPDYLYILACQGQYGVHPFFTGPPCIFKTKDGGKTWEKYDIGSQMSPMDQSGGQGYYDMIITGSAKDPEHILFGLLFLYSSHDGGKTLDKHPQHAAGRPDNMGPEIGGYYGKYDLHTDMQDVHVDEETNETWLSTDGGMIYCKNFFETEPETRNAGIYASEFRGFDQGWNEDIVVGGRNHNGNMVRLSQYGDTAVALRGSENPTGYVFLSNSRKITFSDTRQKLLAPDHWTGVFKDFEGAEQFQAYPKEHGTSGTGMEYDPRYAKSFLIISNPIMGMRDADFTMLWRTTDDGLSYTLVHQFDEEISAYTISRSNPDKIVVGTAGKIYYSLDAGKTFEAYELPQELTATVDYKIAIHPRDENEIWVNTHNGGGIFRTTDNGATWEHLDEGLNMVGPSGNKTYHYLTRFFLTGNEVDAVYAIANAEYNYDGTYLRSACKVVYWDNKRRSWTDISQGLPQMMRINRMLPFFKEGKIRIATDNGIWQTHLVDTVFQPVAQPVILNVGSGENKDLTELQFDSYSIVNQNGATWKWEITPQPVSIDRTDIRNPQVVVRPHVSYDVKLTVTNAAGQSDTKEIQEMIRGDQPTSVDQATVQRDVVLYPTLLHASDALCFTGQGVDESLQLTVYDMQGQIRMKQQIAATSRVALPQLSAGVYMYHLQGKTFQKVGRFMIK